MLLETIAAAIVGLVVLWLVFEPLLLHKAPAHELIEPEDPDETPRGQALLALKEIEFDRETGKLSDEDYQTLKTRYSARAIALLQADEPAVPTEDALEALIAARVRTLHPVGGAPSCPSCGPRPEPDALFCSACGAGLPGAPRCAACSAPMVPGARFCGECGKPLAA